LEPIPEVLNDIYDRALARFKNIKAGMKRKALSDNERALIAQRDRRRGRKTGVRQFQLLDFLQRLADSNFLGRYFCGDSKLARFILPSENMHLSYASWE